MILIIIDEPLATVRIGEEGKSREVRQIDTVIEHQIGFEAGIGQEQSVKLR
jgi:hypothetical protein